jgi:hypothetical protein
MSKDKKIIHRRTYAIGNEEDFLAHIEDQEDILEDSNQTLDSTNDHTESPKRSEPSTTEDDPEDLEPFLFNYPLPVIQVLLDQNLTIETHNNHTTNETLLATNDPFMEEDSIRELTFTPLIPMHLGMPEFLLYMNTDYPTDEDLNLLELERPFMLLGSAPPLFATF